MKKLFFISVIALMLASCSERETDLLEQPLKPSEEQLDDTIDLDEAIALSNKFRSNLGYSRSFREEVENIEYVVRKQSRSNENGDTLAYILNYGDDNGFAIIAARNIANPILAFSDDGNFDLSNENAKVLFIDQIEGYLDNSISLPGRPTLPELEFQPQAVVAPFSKMKLSQGTPWNKYVAEEKEFPKVPAGCVAIATATAMAYSKPELTYHDVTYDLKSMVKTIENKVAGRPVDDDSLRSAVDSMAKIIYWIGKDIGIEYATEEELKEGKGSTGASHRAERLMRKLGFEITSIKYDIKGVIDSLDNGCIIYLSAHKIGGSGHAFIVDGYTYIGISNDPPIITDYGELLTFYPHIHCDWGWGGSNNGYFTGEIFETSEGNFSPYRYRPVKREY